MKKRKRAVGPKPWDLVIVQKVTPMGFIVRTCFCIQSGKPYPKGGQGFNQYVNKRACLAAKKIQSICAKGPQGS